MQFKKPFFLIFLLTIFLFNNCTSKDVNSFTVSGKIPTLTTNYILLSRIDDIQTHKTTFIDSLKVNKKGEFNSIYFLEPNIYELTFDAKKTILLAIDYNQHIFINGNSIEEIVVSGSVDTQLLNDYEDFRNESLNRLVKSVRTKIKTLENESEIAEMRELEVENYKKHLAELTHFIKEKMGTSIAIYPTSIRWNGENNLSFFQELVADFEMKHPNLEITKKMRNKLSLIEKTSIGSFIPSIKMPNKVNEEIQLNAKKGKYTLVDFWASWCPPCRTESALLNDLYSNYNTKGFEIYGISLDSKRENWLKAIEKDNRIWTEVSTLDGFNTPISKEFGITALPTNFLIDETGKIIAVNIHGDELKEKVQTLFSN